MSKRHKIREPRVETRSPNIQNREDDIAPKPVAVVGQDVIEFDQWMSGGRVCPKCGKGNTIYRGGKEGPDGTMYFRECKHCGTADKPTRWKIWKANA